MEGRSQVFLGDIPMNSQRSPALLAVVG